MHGSQQFALVHRYGRRPDLAKIVHTQCQNQNQNQTRDANKRRCVPNNNRWLDRAVLIDLTRDGLAFPR
ncbi:MAG: hypothetical protein ACRDT0_01270 [Pseudonocardiaceae bacterium]